MTAIRYAFIFLFGLVIALAYLRTGRLWLAIGLHAAWDFLVVIFWGEPIGPLNLFHLVEVRYLVGPLLELSLDLVALIFLAFCIYLYTRRRKAEPLDWY